MHHDETEGIPFYLIVIAPDRIHVSALNSLLTEKRNHESDVGRAALILPLNRDEPR